MMMGWVHMGLVNSQKAFEKQDKTQTNKQNKNKTNKNCEMNNKTLDIFILFHIIIFNY